ncbi:protein BASIC PENTACYSTEINE1-like [Silene latifolia]|uniref:protein BASIC PENTACYSTEINE1-like n=1 Tax=Silene latifolia TaxID=37657 RepID=UPI003D76D159
MDGDGFNKNWGYYEPQMKHLNLQLMTSMAERKPLIGFRDSALLGSSNNGYHPRDYTIPTSHYPVDYMRETWIHRDTANNNSNRYLNMMPPTNHSYGFPTETTSTHQHHHHSMQMLRQPESSNEEHIDRMVQTEPVTGEINNAPLKKRSAGKSDKGPKMKKPKKGPTGPREGGSGSAQRAKAAKKTTEVVINGIDMDISSIPIPVCSCTGSPQQCYRWGYGGWQSACCTTVMSMYPLPMSAKRRGARIAGRKMSLGAFKKVLEKLAAEGYNFSSPIDLRTHWAKHGTNKFVTIR